MATIQFNVPDQVEEEFDSTFSGEDKDAIVARLMQEAVTKRRRIQRRAAAIEALVELRASQPAISDSKLAAARAALRK